MTDRLPPRFAAFLLCLGLLPAGARAADPFPSKGPFTSAGTLPGVRLSLLKSDLTPVTSISHQGARLFLTLRDGRIQIVEAGAVLKQPFLDLSTDINLSDEGGLLALAFHPDYAENGFFFINYTNRDGDTVIARYKVAANDPNRADPASGRTLLKIHQPYGNHNGGQVAFGPDGYLYLALGDGGASFDPDCAAQKTDNLLGKMLRIDVDQNVATPPYYGIPASNPFVGPGNPPDEVWAVGFRNPWRFSFDRETGDLWIGDVGQNHREEVDFQPASSTGGENYGWKVMEGTLCSTTEACPASTPVCDSTAYTPPVLEYEHGPHCAVTAGVVYRGSRLPELRGSYLFGDFCTGTVWAASREGTGFKVQALVDRISQLTAFGEDQAGEVYAATLTGRLFSLNRGETGPSIDKVGLFDPAGALFRLKTANTEAAPVDFVQFGPRNTTWTPLAGDWDGDGRSTPGYWDPTKALFRLKNTLGGPLSDVILAVDLPSTHILRAVAGDWDGDGRDTVGLYDVTTGIFHLKNSLSGRGFEVQVQVGTLGPDALPIAGDWDGDGKDTPGLYNAATATFVGPLYTSGGGGATIPVAFVFGPKGKNIFPVVGDWDGDGKDGIGVYEQATALFRLKKVPGRGNPDIVFRFGTKRNTWKPIAGVW
jgi:glucose/arabinose dehydrogenase